MQIFTQTYLGVSYNNSDPSNSTNLGSLQKITFNSTNISFILTDNSTVPKILSVINNITFSGIDGNSPLPVELVSFTSTIKGKNVTLTWSTATEKNNYGFDVERIIRNGELEIRNWRKVGFVDGHGNSNSQMQYSFTDSPPDGTRLSYRLKQIDNDGKYHYSSIADVEIGIPKQNELKQNYPNPFNPSTKITYNLLNDGLVTLKVFDVLGREVATLANEHKKAGTYELTLEGSQLASGIYFCRMSLANYSSSIKMLLMK